MADIFSGEQTPEPMEVTFNDLVGEGRKYQDPDQLAKSYAHAESFVEKLKRENAELRTRVDTIEAQPQNLNPNPNDGQEPLQSQTPAAEAPQQNSPSKGDVDFRSQIREEVKALNEHERAQTNLDTVAAKLVELHGSEKGASDAIAKRARELGVTADWLRDSAARSPSAFFATMGISQSEGRNRMTPSPVNEFRPSDNANLRNFEFFDKMRKDDPKLYFSAATQKEMLAEAKRQGADFYRR